MKFIPAKFCYDNKTQYICTTENKETCGNSSVGRVEASQASGREFEPRLPLKMQHNPTGCAVLFPYTPPIPQNFAKNTSHRGNSFAPVSQNA